MSTPNSSIIQAVYRCSISNLNVVLEWPVEDDPPPEAIDCPYHSGKEAHIIPGINILAISQEGEGKVGGVERSRG